MKKKCIILIIIMILICGCINISYAENLDELRARKDEVRENLGKTNEELENIQIELTQNLEAISKIDAQIENSEIELEKINNNIEEIKKQIEEIQIKLSKIQKSYEKQKDICEKRLVALYEMGDTTYLDVLLNSKSISNFISNYYLIGEIAQYDNDLLDTIERDKKLVEEIHNQINEKQESLKSAQVSQEKALIALENVKTIKNSYINSLSQDEIDLKNKIDEYQSELNSLDSQILFLTVGEISSDYIGGEFLWPTPGYSTITSPFGMRFHPILKIYRMHTGVDIGAPTGAYVVAANSGTVTTSSWLSICGNAIIIDHGGGVCTLYAHASELIAQVGDHVERGDIIMKVGSTGLSTGPHLHFGISINGQYVDPMPYLMGNSLKVEN